MYGREDPAGEKKGFKLVRQFWLYFEINRLERAKDIFDRQLHYLEGQLRERMDFCFYISGNLWSAYLFDILFANLGRARMLENPQIRKMHLAKQP